MATYTKSISQTNTAGHTSRETRLPANQVFSTKTGRGAQTLQAVRGSLWVTLSGDPKDYVLEAGDRMSIGGRQKVVVEALSEATFRIQ